MIEFSAFDHDGEPPRNLIFWERYVFHRALWLTIGIVLSVPLWLGLRAAWRWLG